jgi:glycosyltransferase involved in cell wall biosynthesis
MMKPKVLFIIDSFGVGGAETSLIEILKGNDGIDAIVCGIYKDKTLLPAYQAAGIRTVHLDLRGKYQWKVAFRKLSDLVALEKPHIVHATLYRACILSRFLSGRARVNVVNSLVSDSYGDVRQSMISLAARIKLFSIQLLDRLTARRVNVFVANSNAIKESYAKKVNVDLGKIETIYRGRDPERFRLPEDNETYRKSIREEFNLGETAFVFLHVGRLVASKGQLDLVQAFHQAQASLPETVLLLAGEGPYRNTLEAYVRQHNLQNKIILLGQRDDISKLLAASDVFVTATHYEGHSGAIIEAMFSGTPMIVSDIAPNLETVSASMARIFSRGDVGQLKKELVYSFESYTQLKTLAQHAQQHAYDNFSIQGVRQHYNTLYHNLYQSINQ